MKRPGARRAALPGLALLLLALLFATASAAARPGGGSSYSGGGSSSGRSSGSSGGDGGGFIVELLIWLCIEHPVIGIPLTLLVIALVVVKRIAGKKEQDWTSSAPASTGFHGAAAGSAAPPYAAVWGARPSLDVIRQADPLFSQVVFEDFLYSLYAEVHRARGAGALDRLSAYLSATTIQTLRAATRGPIDSVIVGAMRTVEAQASAMTGARVVVELESNYTEMGRGVYALEQWTLVRGPGARSRSPERVRVLGCPSCGAPQEALFAGTCRHCGRVVNDGSFDWTVQSVSVVRREERAPILTANVAEQGTGAPTIRDPALPHGLAALRAKDPAFDVGQLQARVGLVFQQFQVAWSTRNLAGMRPFLSDALFTTQQYWVAAYLAQGLRNVTDGARITGLDVARVVSDAFFDAITVRVHATGLDYTVAEDGRVVSGSKTQPRAYSEYWTFVRGTNRKGPARTDLACSNCGGPLDVNMTGHCKFCRAKVTTGDFDWVLSRIEQDESYSG